MTTTQRPLPGRQLPQRPAAAIAVLVIAVVTAAVVVAVALLSGGKASTHEGSGKAASQTRDVPAFSSVDLRGSNDVAIHVVGGPQQVVVRGDENLLSFITTTVVAGGELRIGNTANFTTRTPMTVEISTPTLSAARLSGSGQIVIDGLEGDRFSAALPGSGMIRATGTVTQLDAAVQGSGDLELSGLTAREVTATVSGSGEINLTATGRLDAVVSGSGAITYGGNPASVTKSVTGSGSIIGG